MNKSVASDVFGALGWGWLFAVSSTLGCSSQSNQSARTGLDRESALHAQLNALTRIRGTEYNPRRVIRIVNSLVDMDEQAAITAVESYLRNTSDYVHSGEGLRVLFQVWFDVPQEPGYMPSVLRGRPVPDEPKDRSRVPRFPVVLIDDIPLLTTMYYHFVSGEPPSVELEFQQLLRTCRLRKTRLRPSIDLDAVFRDFCTRYSWLYDEDKEKQFQTREWKRMIRNQLVSLVEPVVQWRKMNNDDNMAEVDARWNSFQKHFARHNCKWDDVTGAIVLTK